MSKMCSYEIRDAVLDSMADVLGNDERVPADQRKKFKAYAEAKKAEEMMQDIFSDGDDAPKKTEVVSSDD